LRTLPPRPIQRQGLPAARSPAVSVRWPAAPCWCATGPISGVHWNWWKPARPPRSLWLGSEGRWLAPARAVASGSGRCWIEGVGQPRLSRLRALNARQVLAATPPWRAGAERAPGSTTTPPATACCLALRPCSPFGVAGRSAAPRPRPPDRCHQPGACTCSASREAGALAGGGLSLTIRPLARCRVRAPRSPANCTITTQGPGRQVQGPREQAGPAPRRGPEARGQQHVGI